MKIGFHVKNQMLAQFKYPYLTKYYNEKLKIDYAEALEWIEDQRRMTHIQIEQIPFAKLRNWHFHENTGNLQHESGRFFYPVPERGHDGPFAPWPPAARRC